MLRKWVFIYMRNWKNLQKYDMIKAHRGVGLMQGLECTQPVNELINHAVAHGLLLINAGTQIIRLIPPLIVSKEDIDHMVEILDKCFAQL